MSPPNEPPIDQWVLRVGARGPGIAPLFEALSRRGLLPPAAAVEEAAGVYGPVTLGAVRTAQAKLGVAVDGIVGPVTWLALTQHSEPIGAPEPDYAGATAIGRALLEVADEAWRAGVREQPPGSNRGPEVDQYLAGVHGDAIELLCALRATHRRCPTCMGRSRPQPACNGAPWCARFALWCHERAQLSAPAAVTDTWGDLASAEKWRDAARLRGAWCFSPSPGRIGLILLDGGEGHPAHGHVVIVAGLHPRGGLWTREGNSGNHVAARRRELAEFAGYVDLG